MIRVIVDSILPYITPLIFTDTVAGCVTTISQNVPGLNNKIQVKKFPAYYNDILDLCSNYKTYKDLIPNSKKKSILYFEESGVQGLSSDAHYNYIRANIKLIFWCNLKNINKLYIDSYLLKQAIIKSIPDVLPNIADRFSFIRATLKGEDKKDVAIFNKYSYNEEEKQYLIYPFDYFSLNYQIDFYENKYCEEQIVLNPETCQ